MSEESEGRVMSELLYEVVVGLTEGMGMAEMIEFRGSIPEDN